MADNFEFRDANGVIHEFRATDQGSGLYVPHHILEAGELHLGQVGGQISIVHDGFTRPGNTTAYTAGDAVNNSATVPAPVAVADTVRLLSGSGYIVGLRLVTNLKSITPRFRVHFIISTGVVTLSGDNLPFKLSYSQADEYLFYVDLPAMTTPADATNSTLSLAQDLTVRMPISLIGDTAIYYTLETLDAFTPANAQEFELYIYCDQN